MVPEGHAAWGHKAVADPDAGLTRQQREHGLHVMRVQPGPQLPPVSQGPPHYDPFRNTALLEYHLLPHSV